MLRRNVMSNEIIDVAIIGAGLSGLSCARRLQEAGRTMRLFDKGRGVGGRMATRRIECGGQSALFDHGAQFFTARSPEFQAELQAWRQEGLARDWFHGQSTLLEDGAIESKPDGHPRFCCPRGMSAIAKHMAQGLDVRTDARITRLEHHEHDKTWSLWAGEEEVAQARALVLTPPVPQALELLGTLPGEMAAGERGQLEAMRYERCIAVMLWLSEPARVPGEGALYASGGALSWIGDNQSKGLSPVPALTLHGAPAWSLEKWEASNEEVVSELSRAARAFWNGEILASSVARWKYSKPIEPRQDGCQAWREKNLVFAGDAFGGAKVEGAWISGRSAAQAVLSW